jgi:hypothetical protein
MLCVDLATRRSIADSVFKFFKITNAELNFVGSAQLGFSLLQKGDRPRYRAFSIESDLDIAIVSSSFFDEVWESTFVHFIEKRPWPLLQDFQKYFFRGWIRPDKLPYVTQFRSSWFDFFRNLSREQFDSQHSITCGLYKSNTFLREYHKKAVRERLGAEEINDKNSANEPQD